MVRAIKALTIFFDEVVNMTEEKTLQPEEKRPQHQSLSLRVQTTRGLWSIEQPPDATRRPVYALNSKIQQIINDVREVFGFVEDGNKYVLLHDDKQLEPERTVASYHLKDGDLLILSVQGGNAA
jgi:hypothetical protein